jgi:hypothetical protein
MKSLTLIESIRAKQKGYKRWEDTYDIFLETYKDTDIVDHRELQLKYRTYRNKTINKSQTIDGVGGLHDPSGATVNLGTTQQITTRKRASICFESSSSSKPLHPRTGAKSRESYEHQRFSTLSDRTKDHQRTLGCWMDTYQSLFERTQHLKKTWTHSSKLETGNLYSIDFYRTFDVSFNIRLTHHL